MKYLGDAIWIAVGLGISLLGTMLLLNFRDLATRLATYARTQSPLRRSFPIVPGSTALVLIGTLIVVLTITKIVLGR